MTANEKISNLEVRTAVNIHNAFDCQINILDQISSFPELSQQIE